MDDPTDDPFGSQAGATNYAGQLTSEQQSPPQVLETPDQTEARVAQQQRQTQQVWQSVQAVKAKDLQTAAIPSYTDVSGTTQPVTDSTGAAVTDYDKKNNVGWDGAGNPVQVKQNVNAPPSVEDAFSDTSVTTDPKTGNQYKIRAGLPWQYQGQDPDLAAQALQNDQDKAVSNAASALRRKLTLDERQFHFDSTAAAHQTKALASQFGLDGSEDLAGAQKKISDSFNNTVDGYGSPQANETQGYFGSGPLTPEAQAYRAGIDQKKAAALQQASDLNDTQQDLATRKATLDQQQTQRNALAQMQVDAANRKLAAAGLAPNGSAPTVAATDTGSSQTDNTAPRRTSDVPPSAPAQAIQDAVAGNKPYSITQDGALQLSDQQPLASIQTAVKDGLLPQPPPEVMAAAAQKQKLIDDAGSHPEIKAAIAGAGRGAAFLAGAPVGAGAGALIPGLGETGIGELAGGLVSGSLAAYGYSKLIGELGKYNSTINSFVASQQLHPNYSAAGEFAAFGAGLPKALMKGAGGLISGAADTLAESSQVTGATADAVRATIAQTKVAAKAAEAATGGTATVLKEATPDIYSRASDLVDAIGKAYSSSGGGLLSTIQNLSDLASTAAAQKGPGFAAAQVAKRVGVAAAGMVAIDTTLKEGSKALGLSDEGQTWGGAAQAAVLGAFASGHGIAPKDYDSNAVGDIILRGMAHDVTGTDPSQTVDMSRLVSTPDIGSNVSARMTHPLTPEEQEIYSAFNQKASQLINEGKLPADPSQWQAKAKQILFAGRKGGVANVEITPKAPEAAPEPPTPPVAEQLATAEAQPSPVESAESLQAERAAIVRAGAGSPELQARIAAIDAKLANIGATAAAPGTPTKAAPKAGTAAKSSVIPGVASPETTGTGAVTPSGAAPTVDDAAHEAATSPVNPAPEPSEAQKKAENFQMAHPVIGGLPITIKNPIGSKRWDDGPVLTAHYGHMTGTVGADGENIDAFVKGGTPTDYNGPVFVVNQNKRDGTFDEHKAVIGANSPEEAKEIYERQYKAGSARPGTIATFSTPEAFKEWAKNGDKSQPAVGDVDLTKVQPKEPNGAPGDIVQTEPAGPKATDGGGSGALAGGVKQTSGRVSKTKGVTNDSTRTAAKVGEEPAETIHSSADEGAQQGRPEKATPGLRGGAGARTERPGLGLEEERKIVNEAHTAAGIKWKEAETPQRLAAFTDASSGEVNYDLNKFRAHGEAVKRQGGSPSDYKKAVASEEIAHAKGLKAGEGFDYKGMPIQVRILDEAPKDVQDALEKAYGKENLQNELHKGAEIEARLYQFVNKNKITEETIPDHAAAAAELRVALSKWELPKWLEMHLDRMKRATDTAAIQASPAQAAPAQPPATAPEAAAPPRGPPAKPLTDSQKAALKDSQDQFGDMFGARPVSDEEMTSDMVRRMNEASDAERSPAAPFYAKLPRVIEAIPQETMTVAQAKAAIAKGAKPDEIKMSGIVTDPLSPLHGKQPNDKVTRAALKDYAIERQATAQDVTLGNPEPWLEAQGAVEAQAQKEGHPYPKSFAAAAAGDNLQDDERAKLSDEMRPLTEAAARAYRDRNTKTAGDTHFSQYQLPGAEPGTYREQFVTWPVSVDQPSKETLAELESNYKAARAAYSNSREEDTDRRELFDAADTAQRELWKAEHGKDSGWQDGHSQYSEIANPIVRLRRNIRTDADGNKTLFLEEMQGPNPENQDKMPPELRDRIFEIGMKRAIREAAEEGATHLGWTTGAAQVRRYEEAIRKAADAVTYKDNGDGTFHINAYSNQGTGRMAKQHELGTNIPKSKLDETVGKEIAAKMLAGTGEVSRSEGWKTLRGEDLKVGGEGLKNLYDVTLPRIANKIAKKFGGKTGSASLKDSADFKQQKWTYEGPTPTQEQVHEMFKLAQKAGPDIWVSPFTGARQDAALNRTSVAGALREVKNKMTEGVPFGEAMALHGNGEAAKLFGGEIKIIHPETQIHSLELPAELKKKAIYEGFPILGARPVTSFESPLPPERTPAFVAFVQKHITTLNTPEKFAEVWQHNGPKALQYSQSVWQLLRSFGAKGPAEPNWPGIYGAMQEPAAAPGIDISQTQSNVTPETKANDLSTGSSVEPDRQGAGTSEPGGQGGVPAEPGATGETGRSLDAGRGESGGAAESGPLSAAVPSAPYRSPGDQPVHEPASAVSERPTRDVERGGGGRTNDGGLSPESPGPKDAHAPLVVPGESSAVAAGGGAGESGVGEYHSALTPEQKSDVQFIERRLESKPGVLITNGTGTGKTFSGLGAVHRALARGAEHILVVAPSDKIGSDWTAAAKEFFGIRDIKQLESTSENGSGNRIAVATYANLGQNDSLVRRPWQMIVADEAHYLSQAQEGNKTNALDNFRALTFHPQGHFARARMMEPEAVARLADIAAITKQNRSLIPTLEAERRTLTNKLDDARARSQKHAATLTDATKPKALMMSATPFAYHFSLDYGEGYLFDYPPEDTKSVGRYNHPSPRSQFYMENFGYRMRTGKLTKPENAVATGILERRFAEKLMKDGSMSGRALVVPHDYSRDFILTENAIGAKIDEVMAAIDADRSLSPLREHLDISDYLARRFLLESLKARDAIPRIQKHLAMGRKIVVFHDYKKGGGQNPLRVKFAPDATTSVYTPNGNKTVHLSQLYEQLRAAVPGFDDTVAALDKLESPLVSIAKAFPEAGIFNGDVPSKKRREIVNDFNTSGGKMNVILVQRASGKEGISLHDKDGKHQRVFMDLGIPGRPTDAIQSEGRIYRHGVKSNAVDEYLVTGTNFERWTFAQTIAQRASTAENLAMGERARSLLQSFASGFNDAALKEPSAEQGTGGKAMDSAREHGDPYSNAVALYYTNAKKTSRNKSAEGIDYFPTPEPVGFKMTQWGGIRPGEKVLEPSAGHGAIARFFPDATNRHAVEPSNELAGRLALNAPDTEVHNMRFEDFNTANKFNVVTINPPFGTAGKTAMDHLEKAVQHLREGGRIVALIPRGASMDKRFEKWYESDGAKGVHLRAEFLLPFVAFERAGTSVSARIVVLDKSNPLKDQPAQNLQQQDTRDLTDAKDIKELFARLKDLGVPDRPTAPKVAAADPAATTAPAPKNPATLPAQVSATIPKPTSESDYSPAEFLHTRDNVPVFVAKAERYMARDEFTANRTHATQLGGHYSNFKGAGAVPGFHFKTAEARDKFISGEPQQFGARPVEDSPEFKKWIAGSAIKHPVFHGTGSEFDTFDTSGIGAHFGTKTSALDRMQRLGYLDITPTIEKDRDGSWYVSLDHGDGRSFETEKEANEFAASLPAERAPIKAYLNIRKPLRLPDLGMWHFDMISRELEAKKLLTKPEYEAAWKSNDREKALANVLKKKGYDGIVYRNEVEDAGSDSYIAFDPNQIKSADKNSGKFNPNDSSIFGARPVAAPKPEEEATAAARAAQPGRSNSAADRRAAAAATARATMPLVEKLVARVKVAGEAIRKAFVELPEVTDYKAAKGQWLGAGEDAETGAKGLQRAAHEARMMSAAVKRAVPNPISRMAISRYIEADGDMATLKQQAADAAPKYAPLYQRAMDLSPEEKAIADTAKKFFNDIGQHAVDLGMLSDMLEGYVAHFVDQSSIPANARGQKIAQAVGDIATSRMKTRFDRSIRRVFANMFDLEKQGYRLQSSDIAEVMAAYAQEMNNVVSARTFIKQLPALKAADGRPLAVTSGYARQITDDEGKPDGPLLVKPFAKPQDARDYLPIDHPALRKYKWVAKDAEGNPVFSEGELLIHPDIHRDLSNTLGQSALNKAPIIRAVSDFQHQVKNMMLGWSLFHYVQEGTHAIGHGVNPFKLHAFDPNDPTTRELINGGLMLVNWDAKRDMAEGLGGHGGLLSKIPGLGPLNDQLTSFLFEQYIPGLKAEMAKHAFERNLDRFKKELASGKITRAQVAQKTAQQANDAFGEQNTRYTGENPTKLHAERMAFLAPDFLKSRAKFFADAFTKYGSEQRRALFILAMTMAITAKLLERMLTGRNNWKNPFSVKTDTREFELRSVPGDVLEMLESPRWFISGRLSPLISRTALEAITGRDYRGMKRTVGEQLMDLLKEPIPMSVRGAIDKGAKAIDPSLPKSLRGKLTTNTSDITGREQVASAMGARIKRSSDITDARILGHEWRQKQGLESDDTVYPPSKYVSLKNALEDHDIARAKSEFDFLVKENAGIANAGALAKGFRESMNRPFSGAAKTENAFVASLDKTDRATYDRAVASRNRILSQFTQVAGPAKAAKPMFEGFPE